MAESKQIELADAYKETCIALGEAITMQRILANQLGQAEMKIASLEAANAAPVEEN